MTKKLLLTFLVLLLINGCESKTDQNKNVYKDLRLVHYALEFPRSKEGLQNCKKYKNEQCLNNLSRARAAKQQLFKKTSQYAFELTLNTISTDCALESNSRDKYCPGAISALGFFTSDTEDEKIRQLLSSMTKETLAHVFKMNKEWFIARVDREIWKEWVKSTVLDEYTKRGLMYLLNNGPQGEELALDLLNE